MFEPLDETNAAQLLTISTLHGLLHSEKGYIRLWFFMSRRTLTAYNFVFDRLFTVFSERFNIMAQDIKWKSLSMDFEQTLIYAIEHLSMNY